MPSSVTEIMAAVRDLDILERRPYEAWRLANPVDGRNLLLAFDLAKDEGIDQRIFFKAAKVLLRIPISPAELQAEVVGIVSGKRANRRPVVG